MQLPPQFARRAPNIAFLLLRGSVSALLVVNGSGQNPFAQPTFDAFLTSGFAVCFCLGLFTPLVGLAAALNCTYQLFTEMAFSQLGVIKILLCLSLGLLGAGAYSIDALLFERKRRIL